MSKCSVSIIMPFYNAAKTIENSIKSVLRQNISNYELICVDDGSKDQSFEIIEELAQKNPVIHLIRQEHSGAGAARNYGLKEAKGQYVAFLDADDEFVDSGALLHMYDSCIRENALICGSNRIVVENGKERGVNLFAGYDVPQNGCFISFADYQYDYDYQSFIFDRDFLLANKITFPNYLRYQDPPFFLKAMVAAERFYVVPDVLYKYRYDSNKSMIKEKYAYDILLGVIDNLITAKKYKLDRIFEINRKRVDEEFCDCFLKALSNNVISLLLKINDESLSFDNKEIKILSYIYDCVRLKNCLNSESILLEKLLKIRRKRYSYSEYFEKHNIHSFAIYGIGKFGRILIDELETDGIVVNYGIDQKVTEYKKMIIFSKVDDLPPCDVIIISLLEPFEIFDRLKKEQNRNVITFLNIVDEIMRGESYDE